MKKTLFALIAACLGCCAIAFVVPAISGLTVFGLSFTVLPFNLETLVCVLPLAVLLAVGFWAMMRHRRKCKTAGSCSSDKKCGC